MEATSAKTMIVRSSLNTKPTETCFIINSFVSSKFYTVHICLATKIRLPAIE